MGSFGNFVLFRISDFGFLSDFGWSDFGFSKLALFRKISRACSKGSEIGLDRGLLGTLGTLGNPKRSLPEDKAAFSSFRLSFCNLVNWVMARLSCRFSMVS